MQIFQVKLIQMTKHAIPAFCYHATVEQFNQDYKSILLTKIKEALLVVSDNKTIESAISYTCNITAVHVGEALLKDTALLLPDVLTFFRQKLEEVTQLCNIESDIVDTITPTWLRSQLSSILQPHMAYRCSVKKCGTILYRYEGDLLHALNVALGQVRNLTQMCSGDVQSTDAKMNVLSTD